jgi:hypothetical protein
MVIMNTLRQLMIAAITFMAAVSCFSQEVRITNLDTSSGSLSFTLSPAGTVYDYACSVEWRARLTSGNWTNVWAQPFGSFAKTNGMFYAPQPRFFRIRCTEGFAAAPTPVNYTVTGVISSQTTNGVIYWPDTGNTGLVYYVEHSTGINGPWLSQWAGQTNIHTTATVTNSLSVPMFFRVVTITDSGELPW